MRLHETDIGTIAPDWQIVPLKDVAEKPQYGLTAKAAKSGDTRFLRITDITDKGVNWASVPFCAAPKKKIDACRLKSGDIVFARIGATTGKSYMITDPPDAVFASYLIRVRAGEHLEPGFLIQFFQSRGYWQQVDANKHANLKKGVNGSILSELLLPLPPLPEQKKIAHILSTVQRAIEAQERIIQTTTELKKALMHKLFTEGLHHEPQKQTEIGPVPESWEVVELGDLLEIAQYGMSVKGNPEGNHPILRMTNQVDGQIVGRNLQFVQISDGEFERFRVRRGDILFNRTNSLDLVGRTAIFDIEGEFVFASYLIRLRTYGEKLNPFFLNYYFNTDEIQARLKSIATRAVSQSNISATRLRGFPVPKPRLEEQDEIVANAIALDRKLAIHRAKLEQLEDLFRTLLHELMTAKTRVHNVRLRTQDAQ